jgi:septal ring factor EnvC (AmiA/AmiB activator)
MLGRTCPTDRLKEELTASKTKLKEMQGINDELKETLRTESMRAAKFEGIAEERNTALSRAERAWATAWRRGAAAARGARPRHPPCEVRPPRPIAAVSIVKYCI